MCLNKLSLSEMNKIKGGGTLELMQAQNGQLVVTNQGNGTFTGTCTVQSGLSMSRVSNVLAYEYGDGQWGVSCWPVM